MIRRHLLFSAGGVVLASAAAPIAAAGIEPIEIDAKPPELTGGPWLNSKPLTFASLVGKVSVVHFWTFG